MNLGADDEREKLENNKTLYDTVKPSNFHAYFRRTSRGAPRVPSDAPRVTRRVNLYSMLSSNPAVQWNVKLSMGSWVPSVGYAECSHML